MEDFQPVTSKRFSDLFLREEDEGSMPIPGTPETPVRGRYFPRPGSALRRSSNSVLGEDATSDLWSPLSTYFSELEGTSRRIGEGDASDLNLGSPAIAPSHLRPRMELYCMAPPLIPVESLPLPLFQMCTGRPEPTMKRCFSPQQTEMLIEADLLCDSVVPADLCSVEHMRADSPEAQEVQRRREPARDLIRQQLSEPARPDSFTRKEQDGDSDYLPHKGASRGEASTRHTAGPHSSGILRKRKRCVRFSSEQKRLLLSSFFTNRNPEAAEWNRLADLTGLSTKQVRVWFQNGRGRIKGRVPTWFQSNDRALFEPPPVPFSD